MRPRYPRTIELEPTPDIGTLTDRELLEAIVEQQRTANRRVHDLEHQLRLLTLASSSH